MLAELMVRHNIGVQDQEIYVIERIDEDLIEDVDKAKLRLMPRLVPHRLAAWRCVANTSCTCWASCPFLRGPGGQEARLLRAVWSAIACKQSAIKARFKLPQRR
jgi:hypothetical protein